MEEYEKKISGLGSDLDGQKKAYDEQIKGEAFNMHWIPINSLLTTNLPLKRWASASPRSGRTSAS